MTVKTDEELAIEMCLRCGSRWDEKTEMDEFTGMKVCTISWQCPADGCEETYHPTGRCRLIMRCIMDHHEDCPLRLDNTPRQLAPWEVEPHV